MKAILLVPHPSHRDALLSGGPCGSRVPRVRLLGGECSPPVWTDGPSDGRRWPVIDGPALVLAWEGRPAVEGVDRAIRVLNDVDEECGIRVVEGYSLPWTRTIAERCQNAGLGRIVTLEDT